MNREFRIASGCCRRTSFRKSCRVCRGLSFSTPCPALLALAPAHVDPPSAASLQSRVHLRSLATSRLPRQLRPCFFGTGTHILPLPAASPLLHTSSPLLSA